MQTGNTGQMQAVARQVGQIVFGLAVALFAGCIVDGRYPEGYLILTAVNVRLPVYDEHEEISARGSAIVLREEGRAIVTTSFGTEVEYVMGDYAGDGFSVQFNVMNASEAPVDVLLTRARVTVQRSQSEFFPMFIGHDATREAYVVYDMRDLSEAERKNYFDPGYGDMREDRLTTIYERNVKKDISLEPGHSVNIILDFGKIPRPLLQPEVCLPLQAGSLTSEYVFVFEAWDANKAMASGLAEKRKLFRFKE
jgi:hypothetical protein